LKFFFFLSSMQDKVDDKSLWEQHMGEALLEKYFGQDKQLFDQITMEEEELPNSFKENRGPLSRNIQEKIENLNRFLLAVGYSPKQTIVEPHTSNGQGTLESAIQLVYELIQREQKQKKQQEEWLLSYQQLETKHKNTQKWIEKLEKKLEEKDKQYNALKMKDEKQIRELERQLQKWMEECTQWKIKTANWEQVEVQFGYEMKKKDKEYQRLQQKLQQLMQQTVKLKSVESNTSSRTQPLMNSEGLSVTSKELMEQETYRMMESCFQDRLSKLQKENALLQNFIYELYLKIERQQWDTRCEYSAYDHNNFETPLRCKLELPFESAKEDIQSLFDEKLQMLFSKSCIQRISTEERGTLSEENLNGCISSSSSPVIDTASPTTHSQNVVREPTTMSSTDKVASVVEEDLYLEKESEHNAESTVSIPTVEDNEEQQQEEEDLDEYL